MKNAIRLRIKLWRTRIVVLRTPHSVPYGTYGESAFGEWPRLNWCEISYPTGKVTIPKHRRASPRDCRLRLQPVVIPLIIRFVLKLFALAYNPGNYLFFFSFFNFRFSFGVSWAFFCCSFLPLSFFPLSPISVSPCLQMTCIP